MMLKLEFQEFQKKLTQNSPVFPNVHYCEMGEFVTLTFMSGEGWMYYTIVYYTDITEYSQQENMEFQEAYEMFATNYLSNAIRVEPQFKDELYLKEMEEKTEEYIMDIQNSTVDSPTKVMRSLDILSGDDIVDHATGYSDFLLKLFDSFEKKVVASVDAIQLSKEYLNKTFGEFLKDLFNTVNTVAFGTHIKRYLRMDLLRGLGAAEEELSMDIGYTESFKQKLAQLQQQQLSGYTINGKKWFGIKGVTKELQSDIIQVVQEGIETKKSTNQLKDDIKEKFDKFSDWRANMIARTETNRIINEGKLLGYKESGLEGNKIWITAPFEAGRSSEICQRMKNQVVGLDKEFIDPDTRKSFTSPPAHPNCFLKDTMVSIESGEVKIQDVKVGDMVLTHKNRYREVTHTITSEDTSYFELEVGSEPNKKTLKVTGNHPVLTQRGWILVKDLTLSDYMVKIQ